jgi:hypothetical protein
MPNPRGYDFPNLRNPESTFDFSRRIYKICGIRQPIPPETEYWELLLQTEWNRRMKELREKKEPYVLAPTLPEVQILMQLFFFRLYQREPWMAYSYASKSTDWQFKCMCVQA